MADTKALPVFAFVDDRSQSAELRSYLNQLGGKLDENGPMELAANVLELVNSVGVIGKIESDKEVEMLLSSISSLIVAIPTEKVPEIVFGLCDQLEQPEFGGTGWTSNAGAAVRVLSNLFWGFSTQPAVQHRLYMALLTLCSRAHLMTDLPADVDTLKKHIANWKLSTEQQRKLLRQVHEALLSNQRADEAAKVMIALLGTYTEADAAGAQEDARECVRTAVVDPKSFSLDHLLRLSAVAQLEKGDPAMHEVLRLFATGNLTAYRQFVTANPTFVSEKLRVDEAVLVRKIRLLTLMSLAENNKMVPLSELSRQLDIEEGEPLEEFIIDAIQVNAITGKIDEVNRQLLVTGYQHRTFGRPQWEQLQQRLISLIGSLKSVDSNLKNLASMDAEV